VDTCFSLLRFKWSINFYVNSLKSKRVEICFTAHKSFKLFRKNSRKHFPCSQIYVSMKYPESFLDISPRMINSVAVATSLKCHENRRQLKFSDISQHNCILLRFSIFHFSHRSLWLRRAALHNRFRWPRPRWRRARLSTARQMLNIEIIFSSSVSFLIASRSCKNLAELLSRGDGVKSAEVQNL
jgi:hypothetical protein